MARKGKEYKPAASKQVNATQLIRYRNIMLGLPIKRIREAFIPYGYEIDPNNSERLIPVQKQLEALYYARTFKHKSTFEKLAAWISKETGRTITRFALISIFRYRTPLSVYILPLDDRIRIATDPTEETAFKKDPKGIEWRLRKNPQARRDYLNARRAFAERKEEIRNSKRSK